MVSLADDELGVRNIKPRGEFRIIRPLHAVIWPQDLFAVGQRYGLVRLFPFVARGKGRMALCMPILSEDNIWELLTQLVDDRNDFVAAILRGGFRRVENNSGGR